MSLQLHIFMIYVAVLAAAAQQKGFGSSQQTDLLRVLLKMLLKALIHWSDPEFRKISEDLLISAAVPSFTLVMS